MLTEATYGLCRPRPLPQSGGSAYLDGVLASTVFDLDATIAASYNGSGTTWANLVSAPADSAAKTAYDFYLGDGATSSTYPAFTGSAGSPSAYWALDGGDYFKLKSGTNTNFLRDLHKTTGGPDFWIAMGLYTPEVTSGTNRMFTTLPSTGSGNYGLALYLTVTSEIVTLLQRSGSGNATISLGAVSANTYSMLIMSHSHASNVTRYWFNNLTGTSVAHTFGATTTDANGVAVIAAESDGGLPLQTGTRVTSFAMGNEHLSDSKAAMIFSHMNARHGRTYV